MKVAIMLYGTRVSPRFGYSQGVMVVEVSDHQEIFGHGSLLWLVQLRIGLNSIIYFIFGVNKQGGWAVREAGTETRSPDFHPTKRKAPAKRGPIS